MATNDTQVLLFGYQKGPARKRWLRIETPAGVVRLFAGVDDKGRPVLAAEVEASQFAGEPPYVLDAGEVVIRRAEDAPERASMRLRLVRADHEHHSGFHTAADGSDSIAAQTVIWRGLWEQCPHCQAFETAQGLCHVCHGAGHKDGEAANYAAICGACRGTGLFQPEVIPVIPIDPTPEGGE